jgi:uncharacterized membrane protein
MHVQALSQIYLSYQENVFKTSKQSSHTFKIDIENSKDE